MSGTVQHKAARWANALRIAAATLGAYGLTALAIAALSRAIIRLGGDPVDAVVGLTLASFAIFTGIAVAAFHGRNPLRSWAWLIGTAAVLGAVGWL